MALPPSYTHKYWLTAVISKAPIKTRSITRKLSPFWLPVACVAWRFWLGALSNKGRREQRNREEIGPARTGGFFESVRTPAYGSFRLVRNVRLSIKYFGNLPWESFEGLNKSSPQNKGPVMQAILSFKRFQVWTGRHDSNTPRVDA